MRKFSRSDPEAVLITGASSGFGRSIARYLAGKGYRVFGASRRASFAAPESGKTFGNKPGNKDVASLSMIPMDVTDGASIAAGCGKHSAYFDRSGKTFARMENDEINGLSPDVIAPFVEKIMQHSRPAARYTVGKIDQRLAVFIKQLVPSLIFEKGLMKYYRLG